MSLRAARAVEKCLRRLVRAQGKVIDALYSGRDAGAAERAVNRAAAALDTIEDIHGPGGWARPCVLGLPKKKERA